MARVGRNTPCPCKSGKKFKHCCGAVARAGARSIRPAPEFRQQLVLGVNRREAREHRRRLMQGLGRPVISVEVNGHRAVAVGNNLHWSRRWFTFHDFLFSYIEDILTAKWGNGELAKSADRCHPLIGWYRKVCEYQR